MTAKCLSGYEWSFSSATPSQSPCDVAAQLAGICVGGQVTLAPLVSGVVYLGPSPESADSCRCSSIYYALLSACAYCQTRSYIRWSSYTVNCSTTYLQRFIEPIPRGVPVPLWAYQDVSIDDIFNVTLAQINATNTRNTRPSPTSGSKSENSINIAALAGGIVGGFIVIGLIVGFFSFWLTRRSRSTSRNNNRTVTNQTQDMPRKIPPYTGPGFSVSLNPNPMPPIPTSRVSKPQAPHSLSYMDTTPPAPRIPPAQLPSRHAPFPDTTPRDSDVQSQSEYLMTRITPYTVPSPTSPNVPYTSSSQDSKQPLLTGQSNNFSETRISASAFSPASSSNLSYQQVHPFRPQQDTLMTPLTSSEQLPSYHDIMSGSTSRVPVMEKERLLTHDQQQ